MRSLTQSHKATHNKQGITVFKIPSWEATPLISPQLKRTNHTLHDKQSLTLSYITYTKLCTIVFKIPLTRWHSSHEATITEYKLFIAVFKIPLMRSRPYLIKPHFKITNRASLYSRYISWEATPLRSPQLKRTNHTMILFMRSCPSHKATLQIPKCIRLYSRYPSPEATPLISFSHKATQLHR